jgi:hypothetical protein
MMCLYMCRHFVLFMLIIDAYVVISFPCSVVLVGLLHALPLAYNQLLCSSPPCSIYLPNSVERAYLTMKLVAVSRPDKLDFVGLIDRFAPVQASILQQLEIRDIIALSRVCKTLNHVYNTTIKTQYNINEGLAWFFASPVEFRNVQAETDAIICNSVALYFFLRRPFTEALIIFVRKGFSSVRMHAYPEKDGWSEIVESAPHEDWDEVRLSR